ncbi:MAG TPA: hypothetical protein V6C82_06220 [Chroococcales cyanobacterium]|jgi:hypothetical protein
MKPIILGLDQIESLQVTYWLGYDDANTPIWDFVCKLRPEAYYKPEGAWYDIKDFYWTAYQPQLDVVHLTGAYRDCNRIILPSRDGLELLALDGHKHVFLKIPAELMTLAKDRAVKAWRATSKKPGQQGTCDLRISDRHRRFFTPSVRVIFTEDAEVRYRKNIELAEKSIERLTQIARNSSRNQNDPVELHISADYVPESFYFVERKPRENRCLMNGGIIWHADEGEYGIHT